jgi:hypothetical protein
MIVFTADEGRKNWAGARSTKTGVTMTATPEQHNAVGGQLEK